MQVNSTSTENAKHCKFFRKQYVLSMEAATSMYKVLSIIASMEVQTMWSQKK